MMYSAIYILRNLDLNKIDWGHAYRRFAGLVPYIEFTKNNSAPYQESTPNAEPFTSVILKLKNSDSPLFMVWTEDCKNLRIDFEDITYVSNDLSREDRTYLEDFIDNIPGRVFEAKCALIGELFYK